MKTPEQVDAIMAGIYERWRTRWCGGERGACACVGCVQIGNRAGIFEKVYGRKPVSDPEGLSEEAMRLRSPETYAANKISREEWEAWMQRQSGSAGASR